MYYNEAFDTGVTMPTGVYYKATGYTVGNNSVLDYYFDSSGAPQKIYNLSGNTTLYCRWEQRYSGTYIKTEEELRAIGETGTYHIINDIVLLKEWIPIEIFSGYLVGHDHTIDGLKFTYTSDKDNYGEVQTMYGFIRELKSDGSVSDLTFRNLQISVTKYKDDQTSTYVGAVVGYITRGYLTNVHVVDSDIYANHFREVSSSSKSVNTFVGALAGYVSVGTIADCSVSGNTTIYGEAGKAEGSAAARSFVGGIVGYSYSGNINECTRADSVKVSAYTTTVKSSSAECVAVVGGIVGGRDARFADSTADCTSTLTNLSADGIASKGSSTILVGYDCGWNYLF